MEAARECRSRSMAGLGPPDALHPGWVPTTYRPAMASKGLPNLHPRTIMEILGHSTIAVTMNTYAHVAPALQREAARG